MAQEECCKKCTGHVSRSRRSKRASVWWDELRHQPGPGGPISQPGKWVQYPKARKTGPLPLCLSLDTSQECRDYKRVVDKSWPWRGVWTRKREPSHSSRLASPPAEDQPGGPRVSRGTRNTTKTNKNKKLHKITRKPKPKTVVYPNTRPTAGWADPTTSWRKGARALWKRRPGAVSASSSPGANQEEVRANLS